MSVPAQLRVIHHHMRTAQEHEDRDPVVTYYCLLYSMQTGMKLDSKSPECRKFLLKLMDQLETMKKDLSDNESISQEVVGNAHIENYALKMFLYADNEDRAARFHKNMIKSFYTASLLLDVLSVFGELSEENIQHRKYARWKATYIHNCLKNGEAPQAGPLAMEDDDSGEFGAEGFSGEDLSHGGSFRGLPSSHNFTSHDPGVAPPPGIGFTPAPGTSGPSGASGAPVAPPSNYNNVNIPPGAFAPANTPADVAPPSDPSKPVPMPRGAPTVDQSQGSVVLSAEDFTKAQKLCKYAGSALQYEDVETAVDNLKKALRLLTTGRE